MTATQPLFQTPYGHFAPDARSYVIERADTPKPWVNVMSNPRYGTVVSQAGGGFSWCDHSALSVLTRWRMDLVRDDWGKWLYVRDEEDGALWSVAPQPAGQHLERYRCTHGLGWTKFETAARGISHEWTITVPPDATHELWFVHLRNDSGRPRTLFLCSHFLWNLGGAPDNHREFHRLFIDNTFDEARALVTARKCLWEVPTEKHGHWNTNYPYEGFHTLWRADGQPLEGLAACGDHEAFVGRLGSFERPAWLASAPATKGFGRHGDACAALGARVTLAPGQGVDLCFALGVTPEGEPPVDEALAPWRGPDAQARALHAVANLWSSYLDPVRVESPDPAFNLLNNTWLGYQAISARLWGRSGYWQQSGAFGFRDQLQDSQVYLPSHPDLCAAQCRLHARHQFLNGTVYHWWHPLSEVGHVSRHTDDLLWLPFVLAAYLKETGDFALLDAEEPFVDSKDKTSLYDHGHRAIERVLSMFSERGLPLIGEGDWNDGLSGAGRLMKGESVWLGHFLHGLLRDWAHVATHRGRPDDAARWTARADDLREALNTTGWDGDWYWRATLDDGTVLGSAQSHRGKIFLNAQTWAVLCDVAGPERARKVMDEARDRLLRDSGPLLFTPAFDVPDARVGYLTRYAPGTRENGGVYTHAAVWSIWAAAKLGDGALAWEVFKRLAPPNRGMDPEGYAVEPYVTPGNINGPESPFYGQGGWTWYTGSAAWLRRVSHMGILGIEPTWEGLAIRPALPPHWDRAAIRRPYRGDVLHIEILNEAGAAPSDTLVEVDGHALAPGECITPTGKGIERRVRVRLVPKSR